PAGAGRFRFPAVCAIMVPNFTQRSRSTMTTIQRIGYDSPAYRAGLALRDRVMRQPLGLSIYDEDFSFEKDCVLLAAFDEDGSLTGFGSMTNAGPVRRIEYLCVDPDFQGEGIGR